MVDLTCRDGKYWSGQPVPPELMKGYKAPQKPSGQQSQGPSGSTGENSDAHSGVTRPHAISTSGKELPVDDYGDWESRSNPKVKAKGQGRRMDVDGTNYVSRGVIKTAVASSGSQPGLRNMFTEFRKRYRKGVNNMKK